MLEPEAIEEIENKEKFNPVKIDLQTYVLAMTHIEKIFNMLICQKKLEGEKCKECPVLGAVIQLRENAEIEQFKQIEKHLGFNL